MLTLRRIIGHLFILISVIGLVLWWPVIGWAAPSTTNSTSDLSVTQGYGSSTVLQQGMIVKLTDQDATKVEPATLSTINKMYGVVVAATAASVTLSNNSNNQQVFVATYGHYDVLVSNQNGPIKSGNYITISSLSGIGMKADSNQSLVLGRAAGNFDGLSNVLGSANLRDAKAKQIAVSIGAIPVDILISRNPQLPPAQVGISGFLVRTGATIANKPVSSIKIYISLAILAITAIIAGSMLYAGTRTSILSIGRNPLAKRSIWGSMIRLTLLSVIVFIIGLSAVYLLLRI